MIGGIILVGIGVTFVNCLRHSETRAMTAPLVLSTAAGFHATNRGIKQMNNDDFSNQEVKF